jgi:hypothetical protein
VNVVLDEDVKSVAEYMQRNLPAGRLAFVAKSIGDLGPLLWGHFSQQSEVNDIALYLREDPIGVMSGCLDMQLGAK